MPARDLRFLVVEDHPFQRSVLVRLLQSMGAPAVHEAEDGAAALEVLRDRSRPVDVVVSDVSMPGMDGMQLVRHLGELGVPVSVIFASAVDPDLLASIANMARGYGVRLLGVIDKPPSVAKLAPLIQLHRITQRVADEDAASVPLEEIATSWTNHDFDPWFEPEVDLATSELRALHAVPRWRHPDRGSLEPDAFLPAIRARGLWEEFAWMLLERSAQSCARWRSGGVAATVSIPLLFDGWNDPDLAHRVTGVVTTAGLDPQDGLLLVPPSALANASAPVLENLARLRLEGFALALHPAGDGQAAARAPGVFTDVFLPATTLAAQEALVTALRRARDAGLRTRAEGVEEAAQWDAFRRAGCELARGPLIAPALDYDQAVEWALVRARRLLRAAPGRDAPRSG